jgi:hypothetical protein
MSQSPNQFSQTVEKGVMDLRLNPSIIPCVVKSDESVALVPGQAVKLVDVAGGAPVVTLASADTDDIFGFVAYNIRNSSFAAGAAVEICAIQGGVMYLEASAAIARGAEVMYVVTGQKIATASGVSKTIIGKALDKASGDGSLIRVFFGLIKQTTPAS